MKRIIIVDDEYFVRMGVKSVVNQGNKGHIVVGEADNGKYATKIILEKNPDIVFLDITMVCLVSNLGMMETPYERLEGLK